MKSKPRKERNKLRQDRAKTPGRGSGEGQVLETEEAMRTLLHTGGRGGGVSVMALGLQAWMATGEEGIGKETTVVRALKCSAQPPHRLTLTPP